MPANYTQNYQLNQWSAEDQVRRVDFNADNAKIDAAIKAVDTKADTKADQTALNALSQTVAQKAEQSALDALSATVSGHTAALAQKGNCRIATGTYTGTGTYGAENPITLTFPFEPKLVLVQNASAAMADAVNSDHVNWFMLTMVRPLHVFLSQRGLYSTIITWGDRSVSWYGAYLPAQFNTEGQTYTYVALG